MNEIVLTIEDAARCLPDLVEQIHASGKGALLVKSGQPLARIVPFSTAEQGTDDLIAFLRGWRIDQLPYSLLRYRTQADGQTSPTIDLDAMRTMMGGTSKTSMNSRGIMAFGKRIDQIRREDGMT